MDIANPEFEPYLKEGRTLFQMQTQAAIEQRPDFEKWVSKIGRMDPGKYYRGPITLLYKRRTEVLSLQLVKLGVNRILRDFHTEGGNLIGY